MVITQVASSKINNNKNDKLENGISQVQLAKSKIKKVKLENGNYPSSK